MKITMNEAKKMLREGYTIMHIQWFTQDSGYGILYNTDLQQQYPDCSHVLVAPNKRWADTNSVAALILSEEHDGD